MWQFYQDVKIRATHWQIKSVSCSALWYHLGLFPVSGDFVLMSSLITWSFQMAHCQFFVLDGSLGSHMQQFQVCPPLYLPHPQNYQRNSVSSFLDLFGNKMRSSPRNFWRSWGKMFHYGGTHSVLRNFEFSCESVRLIQPCIVKKVTPITIQSHCILDQHGRTSSEEMRSAHSGIVHYFVCHKSGPLSSMATGQAIMLKYQVLITVCWHGRILRPTLDSPAQKPFMMCHPPQGLIRNRDKREEVITIVQSQSYSKGVMRLRCHFLFTEKQLVWCMVKILSCIFSE